MFYFNFFFVKLKQQFTYLMPLNIYCVRKYNDCVLGEKKMCCHCVGLCVALIVAIITDNIGIVLFAIVVNESSSHLIIFVPATANSGRLIDQQHPQ